MTLDLSSLRKAIDSLDGSHAIMCLALFADNTFHYNALRLL